MPDIIPTMITTTPHTKGPTGAGSQSLDRHLKKPRSRLLKRVSDQSIGTQEIRDETHFTNSSTTSLSLLPVVDREEREEWPGTPKPGRSRVERFYAKGLASSKSSLRSRLSNKSERGSKHKDEQHDDGAKQWMQPPDSFLIRGSVAAACDYALASVKRDDDFHALFRSVPAHDGLLEDYKCALHKDILLQGHIYVSEHHLCFKANIFGWVTNLVLAYSEITQIEKRMTAKIIPNGIQITTANNAKHVFASFLTRDQAYDQMMKIWNLHHPPSDQSMKDQDEDGSVDTSDQWTLEGTNEPSEEETNEANQPAVTETQHDTTTPTESHVYLPVRPKDSAHTAPVSKASSNVATINAPQECPCAQKGNHYAHVALDGYFPGSVETMYRLLHSSDFIGRYMEQEGYGQDISLGEWHREHRRGWYNKRCATGPSLTRCVFKEERICYNIPQCTVVETIAQTPDRSMGSVYEIKTRTCITQQTKAKVHVLVTCQVEYTQSGLSSSIIEKDALEESLAFYARLHAIMRRAQHLQSFTNDQQLSIRLREEQAKALEASRGPIARSFWSFRAFVISLRSHFSAPRLTIALVFVIVLSNIMTAWRLQNVSTHLNIIKRSPDKHEQQKQAILLDTTWMQRSMDEMHERIQELKRETQGQKSRLNSMMSSI